MGWFDEQIKERKLKDEEIYTESYARIARAVLGGKVAYSFDDNRITEDAIDEILKFYHLKHTEVPERIRKNGDVLEYVMRPHGIMRREVVLSKGWYKDAVGPMLATRLDDDSTIALIPCKISGYYYWDHNTGSKIKINASNEANISKEAITFYKPFPLRKITIKDILIYMVNTLAVSDVLLSLAATAIVALIGMLIPALSRQLFGPVVEQKNTGMLMAISVFMICSTVSGMVFTAIKNIIIDRVNVRMDSAVSAATMMRFLSLPASFFKKYSSGELTNYQQQVNMLCGSIVNIVMSTGLSSVFSLVYITQIIKYAPALVVPALVVIVLTIFITIFTSFVQIKIQRKSLQVASKENGVTYEIISGIQKIKLAGAEKRAFAKWADSFTPVASVNYNPPLIIKTSLVWTTAIGLIGTIVMYYLAIKTGISSADYFAFNAAYATVSAAFVGLAGITVNIAGIGPTLELIKPILDAEPEVSEGRKVISGLSGNIEINNVSFKYEKDSPYILDNLSIKIRSGQYVAIVGKTGCGKSTLVRLLLGFEKAEKGGIFYDGHDINSIDLKSLRKNMGVVIQDGKLFSGDIFSNITITAPSLTVDDAWEAAEMAGLADDIRNMPMGMFTYLTEGEGGVSGGQRQRILIARAVAPKPKVLIFDEATSALDNITQKHVSDALDALKCTRIVIAHRLSTIKNADRIIVLDGGSIIEDGSYDELIAQNGFFAELVERQRIDV